VRIISGQWRSRKLSFPDANGLRPTLGRTRETLFNWLRPHLAGAACLDLFAGSGALGFEAASVGAESVTFVDSNRAIVDALTTNIALLAADNCHAVHTQAEQFLRSTTSSYEIIFLDPPYKQPKLLESALEALSSGGLIGGHIYMEAENNQTLLNLCERFDLQVAKSTSAGSTFSVLARR
jgi:16S rRNA (guanine966-N2)-methyltransferase